MLIAALSLTLSLGACGGSTASTSNNAACDPNASISMADFTPAPSIDPIRTIGPGGDGAKAAVYDPLIRYVAGTGPGTGLQPALATAWKSVNPTLFDVTLRKGVSFTDGTPFNAAAVKANIDRAMTDPKTSGSVSQGLANLQSVNVINDYEVQFQLKQPHPAWLEYVAYGMGYMASPKSFTGNLDVTAVGTGLFKLTRFSTSVGSDYVRNDNYWDPALLKCAPKEFHLLNAPDAAAQLNGGRSGQLAVIYVAPASVPQAKASGLTVKTTPAPAASTIYFNRGRPPFNNETVRQALMYAVDRDAVAKGIYQGLAEPDVQLFPATSESYNPGSNYQPKAYAYNPTKARQLLAQAGYPSGISLTLDVDQSRSVDLDVAQALQSQMGAAGIKVSIQSIPSTNTFYGGQGDAYFAAQSGKQDDTDVVDGALQNTQLNPPRLPMPPEIQPLWLQTRSLEFGSPNRKSQEQQLSALIVDHAWIVPVVTVDKIYGISPCVLNFKPTLQGAYQPIALEWKKGCKYP
jgi:peptide/nickel transport system substrate-binding protein